MGAAYAQDGIVYDVSGLLAEIRAMVRASKDEYGIPEGPCRSKPCPRQTGSSVGEVTK